MPDGMQNDPFKPRQPVIPGVPAESAKEEKTLSVSPSPISPAEPAQAASVTPAPAARLKSQIVLLTMALIVLALLAAIALAWRSRHTAADEPGTSTLVAAPALAVPADIPAPAKPAPDEPVAPGVIATAEELAKPWASKNFVFRDDATGQSVPAMVVHLPRGGYWGFSLVEPYGSCRLEYITDLQKLAKTYDFSADHPMVGDPCSHTVFDLLRYGGPMNAEVRGDIVHGSGLRPPMAIEIEERGSEILAVKME